MMPSKKTKLDEPLDEEPTPEAGQAHCVRCDVTAPMLRVDGKLWCPLHFVQERAPEEPGRWYKPIAVEHKVTGAVSLVFGGEPPPLHRIIAS